VDATYTYLCQISSKSVQPFRRENVTDVDRVTFAFVIILLSRERSRVRMSHVGVLIILYRIVYGVHFQRHDFGRRR
jgi:hypothetical protein